MLGVQWSKRYFMFDHLQKLLKEGSWLVLMYLSCNSAIKNAEERSMCRSDSIFLSLCVSLLFYSFSRLEGPKMSDPKSNRF